MKIADAAAAQQLLEKYSEWMSGEWYAMIEDVVMGIRPSVTVPDAEVKKWEVLLKRGTKDS